MAKKRNKATENDFPVKVMITDGPVQGNVTVDEEYGFITDYTGETMFRDNTHYPKSFLLEQRELIDRVLAAINYAEKLSETCDLR